MTTPKRHLFSAHAVAMIDKDNGIADCNEDWVERQHQMRKKVTSTYKTRNLVKLARYEIRQDGINNNQRIKEIQKGVSERASRKGFRAKALREKQIAQAKRHGLRQKAIDEFPQQLEENPTLKSLKDRSILDRLRPLENRTELQE
ncbi:unnamed protein product [Cylindrotheca closterium]|uniref:Uncharacterized protein n=1 Tax=Cylindrotheca closterium TaxID=2856 RepID=A0AAD2PWQ0_9STRA|nr:unnamed protein product [Cylindrotheca closterium]